MPMPHKPFPIVPPIVELAFDRFDDEWPACWLVYGDDALGWKDPDIGRVFLRIDRLAHLQGDARYREYQVRALTVEAAIDRAVRLVECPYELHVTIYKVTLPPSVEQVGFLEAQNARIQRDPAWGVFRGQPRCLGTRSRGPGGGPLSASRRRRLSCGL